MQEQERQVLCKNNSDRCEDQNKKKANSRED